MPDSRTSSAGRGSWPSTGGDYKLVVNVDSPWDGNNVNDTNLATSVSIDDVAVATEPNETAGPFVDAGAVADYTNLNPSLPTGVLRPGERVRIDGLHDMNKEYDTFGFTAGPGMISVYLELVWATGTDIASMYLWDEFNGQIVSEDVTVDVEGPVSVISLVPGRNYYVGVYSLSGMSGNPYTLKITGGSDS